MSGGFEVAPGVSGLIPAVTPGLDPGTGLDRKRSQNQNRGPRTGPGTLVLLLQITCSQPKPSRSWESTFCAFGRGPQGPSLVRITSSCIPRRSAGTGGRDSADFPDLFVTFLLRYDKEDSNFFYDYVALLGMMQP